MPALPASLRRPAAAGALLLAAFLGACSDSTAPVASKRQLAAPATPAVAATVAVVAERVEFPGSSDPWHATMLSVYPSNAQTYTMTATPGSTKTWIIGQHMLTMPLWTICDPWQSTYGVGTWLDSCVLLKSKIKLTATTWIDANGRPQIDFSPALRFIPNTYGQLPVIYLRDPAASIESWSRIDYCSGTGACVNEVATDAALVTHRDPVTGYLFRLIRHFSGYNVWA